MQTFLPYAEYNLVAESLDSKRLNKQILECYQILNVLSNDDPHAGWRNHPAVKMWRGREFALWDYVQNMIVEADDRGIKTDKNSDNLWVLRKAKGNRWGMGKPLWMSNKTIMERVTTTHKANLYKKAPEMYPQFREAVNDTNNKPCCDRCQYYWVTHEVANLV